MLTDDDYVIAMPCYINPIDGEYWSKCNRNYEKLYYQNMARIIGYDHDAIHIIDNNNEIFKYPFGQWKQHKVEYELDKIKNKMQLYN